MASILVVDDYSVTQRVLRAQLAGAGYHVHTCGSAAAGLAALAQMDLDLAIVDIAMPEMDGVAMLGRIRADPALANLPVIMLTASSVDADRARAKAAGATRFLTKPASTQELLEAVAECLAP